MYVVKVSVSVSLCFFLFLSLTCIELFAPGICVYRLRGRGVSMGSIPPLYALTLSRICVCLRRRILRKRGVGKVGEVPMMIRYTRGTRGFRYCISCIVAKRADETGYLHTKQKLQRLTRGTLASPSTRPIVRHRVEGGMRVHRTEFAGDTASDTQYNTLYKALLNYTI